MSEDFKVNIDRLKKSGPVQINICVDANILSLEDKDLSFNDKVNISGEAYIATHDLVLHLNIKTNATQKCIICNDDASIEIKIPEFYHTEQISKLKSPIYDFSHVLREEILLEVPHFVECNQGTCPEREFAKQYIHSPDKPN